MELDHIKVKRNFDGSIADVVAVNAESGAEVSLPGMLKGHAQWDVRTDAVVVKFAGSRVIWETINAVQ